MSVAGSASKTGVFVRSFVQEPSSFGEEDAKPSKHDAREGTTEEDGDNANPGVKQVEVGDVSLGVVLAHSIDAEAAEGEGEGDGVQQHVPSWSGCPPTLSSSPSPFSSAGRTLPLLLFLAARGLAFLYPFVPISCVVELCLDRSRVNPLRLRTEKGGVGATQQLGALLLFLAARGLAFLYPFVPISYVVELYLDRSCVNSLRLRTEKGGVGATQQLGVHHGWRL
uniref:Uncharacterized protein n=1 Tax=Oryza rufipogon TaxID=4529 RepID=A0A0E0R0J3_ORYRU